ncbi:MAG: hypothetical protein ABSH44_05125 [Bryobacteraceae bacterium]|jgi:hypothetical protein
MVNRDERPALNLLSTAYLLLPVLLFLVGYLRWYYGIPLAAVLVVLLVLEAPRRWPAAWPRPAVPVIVLLLVWTALSGLGGLGYQNHDYQKHNGILKTLVEQPWPPVLADCGSDGQDCPLLYYVGFYLPSATVGRLWGWSAANHAFFLYGLVGVLLAARWFQELSGRKGWLVVLYFVLFSGLDFLGYWAGSRSLPPLGQHLEPWPHLYCQFNSMTVALFWVPQHALPAWLTTAMVLDRVTRLGTVRGLWCLGALLLLFSPLVAAGLMPFLLYATWQCRGRGLWSPANLGAACLLVPVLAAYYASSALHAVHGPLWAFVNLPHRLPGLVAFYLLELAPFAYLYWRRPSRDLPDTDRGWFCLAVVVLLGLPLYVFGYYGDLCLRGSMPAMFVVAVWTARTAAQWLAAPGWRRWVFVTIFAVGSLTAGEEIWRSLSHYGWRVPDPASVKNPALLEPRRFVGSQYQGRKDAFFFRYLAKPACGAAAFARQRGS